MKKTILVPVDFTPVSHNALKYACELSRLQQTEVVAVHLLDENLSAQFDVGSNLALRSMADRMYNEIVQKTKKDLDNFVLGLKNVYGDIIKTVITTGVIFDTFNTLAADYESSLIVMGTHGIVGLQHLFGSRAYKVVLHTNHPFLVVQEAHYQPITTLYLAFHSYAHLSAHATDIAALAAYFPGKLVVNLFSGELRFPESLQHLQDRVSLIQEQLQAGTIVDDAVAAGADAIGICIDELDNINHDKFGLSQEKIIANKQGLPVLCLPYHSLRIKM